MAAKLSPTNGVSYGTSYTVTAADQSATYVEFTVGKTDAIGTYTPATFNIVAVFNTKSSANATIANTGAVVTYPATGTVRIANGGSYTLTAGQIIDVIIQRAKATV
ncbi:MAG: hypothetical protein JXM74_05850 [Fusobacteriaceae bacterium]|nr:hypothetical protein [Fusobacteriaceae bacterium]